jgi:prephenate dehydrogenase
MAIKLALVGLGQIGASIGLALEKQKENLQRVGHDRSPFVSREAKKRGAVDQTKINLPATVRGAKIVVLSLPFSEMRSTMEVIAPDLEEDAVVMDTAPVKTQVTEWVKEFFPPKAHYVGLVPAINPKHMNRVDQGVEAALPDMFHDSVIMLDALPGTPGEAVQLASDFIRLLGATPLFVDLVEADGLMASAHLAPQLVAAATLNAMIDQPGWKDVRKLAGHPFAMLAAAMAYQDDLKALEEATMSNRENVTRVLDGVIASMSQLRNDIAGERQDALSKWLKQADDGHESWLVGRLSADWDEGGQKEPSIEFQTFWERYFGTGRRSKKDKK